MLQMMMSVQEVDHALTTVTTLPAALLAPVPMGWPLIPVAGSVLVRNV